MSITFGPLTAASTFADGRASLRLRAWGAETAQTAGRCRFRVRVRGASTSSIVVGTPQLPVACIHPLRLNAAGSAHQRDRAGVLHPLKLEARGLGGRAGTVSGRTWLKLRAFGQVGAGQTAFALLIPQSPEVSGYADQWFGFARQSVGLGARPDRLYAAVSRSPLGFSAGAHGTFSGTGQADDLLAFGERLEAVIHALASSGLTFSTLATGEYRLLGRAIARLVLTGQAAGYVEALQLIGDALVLGEVTDQLQLANAGDILHVEAKVEQTYTALVEMVERLVLAGAAVGAHTLTVLLREEFVLGAQPNHQAELAAQISECIGLAMGLTFDTGEFLAWVMNTESRALSTYTQFPFNSFAKIGGRYYGAHAGGIARLGGRTDMGEPIRARLRLGMSDFGGRLVKSFSDVFFGMAADGQMLLKAIYVDERTAEKHMAIYKVMARPSAVSRETRAKVGRGMKAVDWDFEIENVDGADFDLQTIQFYPTQTSRRTRG